ncbi:hypothetical protein FDUTEX481_02508 [Tolypothrix sp. PCC 7601]|nr:hypothetical protein FDUTEX481_02508 [Tolypothrix sp. PCC 7601]
MQEKGERLKVFSCPFSPSPFALNQKVLVLAQITMNNSTPEVIGFLGMGKNYLIRLL